MEAFPRKQGPDAQALASPIARKRLRDAVDFGADRHGCPARKAHARGERPPPRVVVGTRRRERGNHDRHKGPGERGPRSDVPGDEQPPVALRHRGPLLCARIVDPDDRQARAFRRPDLRSGDAGSGLHLARPAEPLERAPEPRRREGEARLRDLDLDRARGDAQPDRRASPVQEGRLRDRTGDRDDDPAAQYPGDPRRFAGQCAPFSCRLHRERDDPPAHRSDDVHR